MLTRQVDPPFGARKVDPYAHAWGSTIPGVQQVARCLGMALQFAGGDCFHVMFLCILASIRSEIPCHIAFDQGLMAGKVASRSPRNMCYICSRDKLGSYAHDGCPTV